MDEKIVAPVSRLAEDEIDDLVWDPDLHKYIYADSKNWIVPAFDTVRKP